jgi:hypothetical protein
LRYAPACRNTAERFLARVSQSAVLPLTGNGATAGSGILFSDLLKKRFPPEDWLVEGLITTGLSVLTGASKIGKSWAALQLVTALDRGGCLWGSLKARRCDVLYYN